MTNLVDLDRDAFIEATRKSGHQVRPFQALNAMDKEGDWQSSCGGCGLIVRSFGGSPLSFEKGFARACTNAMHGGKPPPEGPVPAKEGDIDRAMVFAITAADRLALSRMHRLSAWDEDARHGYFIAVCERCHLRIMVRQGGRINSELGTEQCIGPETRVQGRLMEDG